MSDFYRSTEWMLLRLSVINNRLTDKGETVCEHCGKPIVRSYDCIGHHTVELTERNVHDATVALNEDNIMLVHHVCHNKIHHKLGYVSKQIYLVWGSPLSGKSTWVNEVLEPGDMMVDMDSIWQCISGCERYVKPNRLIDNVFGIRDALLDMVRMRRGGWNNAYIIGGYPLIGERERLINRLGAREIFIECEYEECLARLKCLDGSDGRNYGEWKKYIDDWWEKYTPT